jgi:NAD(P)-dependent dehydrogenase (short-subunit alcohol dehydrogenase family)
MRGLKGKVALVTGASKNIGRSIMERLAAEGVRVVGLGRSVELGEQLAAQIRTAGGEAAFIGCDVTDEAQVKAAVEQAAAHFGHIDIVVNNAAATQIIRSGGEADVVNESLESFDQFMKVGVYGPFLLAREVLPLMLARGSGVFVSISSVASVAAVQGMTAYGPSKAALESLTNQIAVEYGDRGIRAVSLRVGPIRTDENLMLHDHPAAGPLLRSTQMLTSRAGAPADVAGAVAFVASDEAAFITGSVINVEAGQVAKQMMPDLKAAFAAKGPG